MLLVATVASAGRAYGTTWYVRPAGDDGVCSGRADADAAGAGSSCAFVSIDRCESAMAAGDTCLVAAGTYTQTLGPGRSGSASARIAYACPSRQCVIRPAASNALDLAGRSDVTVDGFTFEGRVVPWNTGSARNLVRNIAVRGVGGQAPFFEINTGCGSDNTLESFSVEAPQDSVISPLVVGVNCTAPGRDTRATFRG